MQEPAILDQVLRGLALNRTPGFHFPVHFLEVSFDEVTDGGAHLSIDPGPHCVDATGAIHRGALALQADLAMSAGIRAGLDPAQRLGTVSMTLHLTGVAARGRIEAHGWFEGMVAGAAGRQAQARFVLRDANTTVGFGGGSFMVLDPPPGVSLHPTPLRQRGHVRPPGLALDDLTADEQSIYGRARKALEAAGAAGAAGPVAADRTDTARCPPCSFIEAFWGPQIERSPKGATAVVDNAGHVGNRVGHMQGGLLLDFLATCADAALPAAPSWQLTASTVAFVSPGAGPRLHASSQVVHQGGLTAVVRTEVRRSDGRLVLDGVTHHSRSLTPYSEGRPPDR